MNNGKFTIEVRTLDGSDKCLKKLDSTKYLDTVTIRARYKIMLKKNKLFFLPISFLMLITSNILGSSVKASSLGVDIYCVMRNGGNTHEASWKAAYQSIKNERGGLFKISPRQAAAIIVQSVVREPEKHKNCVAYLGDLYPADIKADSKDNDEGLRESEIPQESNNNDYIKDRYSY